MTTHHAILWIDHNSARMLALDVEGTSFHELGHVHSHDEKTHPKKFGGHRHPADARFVSDVEALLARCDFAVVVGPGAAKDELVAHLEHTRSPLRKKIVAVSPIDRETDGELAAHAREVFRSSDHMKGIHVDTHGA